METTVVTSGPTRYAVAIYGGYVNSEGEWINHEERVAVPPDGSGDEAGVQEATRKAEAALRQSREWRRQGAVDSIAWRWGAPRAEWGVRPSSGPTVAEAAQAVLDAMDALEPPRGYAAVEFARDRAKLIELTA